MLLTKDETIAELEANIDIKNHVSCEVDRYSFHAAKLISVEPYFVETKETNDVGFTKSFMKGFFRLKFQEGNEIKIYEADANPEEINKLYYYVIKDGVMTNIFPHKDDIKSYILKHFDKTRSGENSGENEGEYWHLFIPMFMAFFFASSFSLIDMPFFFKMGLAIVWGISFISILFSSSCGEKEAVSDETEKKIKSFVRQIDNIEE